MDLLKGLTKLVLKSARLTWSKLAYVKLGLIVQVNSSYPKPIPGPFTPWRPSLQLRKLPMIPLPQRAAVHQLLNNAMQRAP
jgi:hypothetical protein